jgi:hypothetical protein
MSASWTTAAEAAVKDLRKIFGARLRSVVVYGAHADGVGGDEPVTCLALVASLEVADLDACAGAEPAWRRQNLATPLILPEDEFRRSLDAFPLEYAEIIRAHVHVYGDDPFNGLTIASEDLRRACETQIKSHLLHLRENYIEAAGRPQLVAELAQAAAGGFAALLRNVARLHGVPMSDRIAAAREGARLAGLPDDIVADVLTLEHTQAMPTTDPARLFPRYLAAVEDLARFVDSWRTR